ncbi:MAG: hypothetical protein ACREXS_12520 [Gammaproteobacteria bacterium]
MMGAFGVVPEEPVDEFIVAHHVMGALVEGLLNGRLSRIRQAINNAVAFLATNARRAHPKRDRRNGRLELNLEPVFNAA